MPPPHPYGSLCLAHSDPRLSVRLTLYLLQVLAQMHLLREAFSDCALWTCNFPPLLGPALIPLFFCIRNLVDVDVIY